MGALANFLVSVFGSLFGFLATYFGKKAAIGAAVGTTLLAATTAFYLAIKALVVGLMSQITNQWFLMAFYAIWPSNAELCLSACIAADLAVLLYRYQLMTIRAVASAS